MSIVFTDTAVLGGGERWSALPDLGGAIFAGWLLGTGYHGPAAFDGSPVTDLSGNGRNLTSHGAAPAATATACSPAAWFDAAFSIADVFAVRGEATIITVAASTPGRGFVEAGAFDSGGGAPRGLAIVAAGSGIELTGYNYPGGPQVNLDGGPARDAATFEFHAASGSADGLLVYRRRADFTVAETAVSAGAVSVAGTAAFRIGRSIDDGPFTGGGSLAAVLVASRALGRADLDAAYDAMRALLGGFALSI